MHFRYKFIIFGQNWSKNFKKSQKKELSVRYRCKRELQLEPGALNQTKTNLMVFILLTWPKKRESLKPTVQSFEEARMWLS